MIDFNNTPFDAILEDLAQMPKEKIIKYLVNKEYNDFLTSCADDVRRPISSNFPGTYKRIPYMGYSYKDLDFFKPILIGKKDTSIGFMAKNEWGYPERFLTAEETKIFMSLIDNAMKDPIVGEEEFAKLWDYVQTLKI